MAVPVSKDEHLVAIEKKFAQLSEDLDRIPEETLREFVLDGHVTDTMMSPSYLVAHLIGWNRQILTSFARIAFGIHPSRPACFLSDGRMSSPHASR
ncbi:ClbS/DfsB family four-helix bundle protein [Microbacterium saperdae]|uniref:ClbS/DfsB family four-helix bundle protein n=1 Tax=Microbacterium saperdae TaxID=69368 RepID=UPI0011513690|nr:ClbS/DfsB family four-helix bundle protein [Microbacterium saperdae]GGM62621.1 hypothetical protein GCM10010489_37590 [Microbacterium saperdae]